MFLPFQDPERSLTSTIASNSMRDLVSREQRGEPVEYEIQWATLDHVHVHIGTHNPYLHMHPTRCAHTQNSLKIQYLFYMYKSLISTC